MINKKEIIRIQVEINKNIKDEMEHTMLELNIRTIKDFILTALTVFYWMIRQKRSGCKIYSKDPLGNIVEFEMPVFMNITK